MKKQLFQLTLAAMVLGLILSCASTGDLAFEAPNCLLVSANGYSGWKLQIDTLNDTVVLTLDDLTAMPKTIVNAELFCSGQLVDSGAWGGVKLAYLLQKVGYESTIIGIELFALDGYTTTISIYPSIPDNVIIAYEKDATPLPETLRLVIPGANGNSWISMITRISPKNAIDPRSPNPHAASIITDQLEIIEPLTTPAPPLTPEPSNQTLNQPIAEPPKDQHGHQQDVSNPDFQHEYLYLTMSVLFIASAAAGCLFQKRKKK
ncbi:MAG: molybdopterin-dependent oxidoreductase [Candidatus Bathyarchaeota archaeon]|nr:molybdopterin-dependent oxidoreductase [Candidatus Bathyarchaeota archaeon]